MHNAHRSPRGGSSRPLANGARGLRKRPIYRSPFRFRRNMTPLKESKQLDPPPSNSGPSRRPINRATRAARKMHSLLHHARISPVPCDCPVPVEFIARLSIDPCHTYMTHIRLVRACHLSLPAFLHSPMASAHSREQNIISVRDRTFKTKNVT